MFDARVYFQTTNATIMEQYEQDLVLIREVVERVSQTGPAAANFQRHDFIRQLGGLVLAIAEFERRHGPDYWQSYSLKELEQHNEHLYAQIRPEGYQRCYANPEYASTAFGKECGPVLACFYDAFIKNIPLSVLHKLDTVQQYNHRFLDFCDTFAKGALDCDALTRFVVGLLQDKNPDSARIKLARQFDPDFSLYPDFLRHADLGDIRYLYQYGEFISEIELKTAALLASYDRSKIETLAECVVKAFKDGFSHHGKTLVPGAIVRISFWIGQERVAQALISELERNGLVAHCSQVRTGSINPQYDYDHNSDLALYLDQDLIEQHLVFLERAYEHNIRVITRFGGDIVLNPDKFAEDQITPLIKPERLDFSPQQRGLLQNFMNKQAALRLKHIDRDKTSSTCIAFPSPAIGDNFEEIFAAIWEVNLADSHYYERIQQKMIEVMDQGHAIRITGRRPNTTDLLVKLQDIADPERESNFLNGVADVNIPAGEVFTSPRLKGTHGLLHIDSFFENGLEFKELKLYFEDGFISDYMCRNFDSPQENRDYIEKNLLLPHKTLPMGEFAIGTNTLAYVVAKKFNIAHKLSTLISEKMAPHIAIGDTCFALQENMIVVNRMDNKIMAARDNEKSARRFDNFNDAYTFKHSDIVIPFEAIEAISVLIQGKPPVDIIRNSRFVLPGTEELNIPLDR